jgi:hypothetical protein
MSIIEELTSWSRRFGKAAQVHKLELLDNLHQTDIRGAKKLLALHDTLLFMRAYPDSAQVHQSVCLAIEKLRLRLGNKREMLANTGYPGTANSYSYSYGVLQRLTKMVPGTLCIDWEEVDDSSVPNDVLSALALASEQMGLEDQTLLLEEWLQQTTPAGQTDLEALLSRVEHSGCSLPIQEFLFEACDLPYVYPLTDAGSGRAEVNWPVNKLHVQSRPIDRNKFDLSAFIRKPLGGYQQLNAVQGEAFIQTALKALCCRNLEIFPLIYANPEDVVLTRPYHGLQIALVGVLPEQRSVLESLFFFMVLKNGVPVAYGPAGACLGCCEMGINLFPEFRGGEIRLIYALFMRAMYHLASVRYFFLTPYGMGEDNEDALRSGAFWFYRKLGFLPTNPSVETLARAEEALMQKHAGHRSSRRVLKKLSHTSACLDLSGGKITPLSQGELGVAVSRNVGCRHGHQTNKAEQAAATRLKKTLGAGFSGWSKQERHGWRRLAPVLNLIEDLKDWKASDKIRLLDLIKAKGSRHERDFQKKLTRYKGLGGALHVECNRS